MIDYFKLFHHEWIQKLGTGIKCIYRIRDKVTGKYRAFEIERNDGSKTDISYIISNIKKPNIKADLNRAFRHIVMPQISRFKIGVFQSQRAQFCEFTGEKITYNDCHIDHYEPSFDTLVSDFLLINNITNLDELLVPSKDNQTMCEIKDKEIAYKFYVYHSIKANLRAVSVNANLSILKKV